MQTFAGFPYDFMDKNMTEDSDEQIEAEFERLWKNGQYNTISINDIDV